VKEW